MKPFDERLKAAIREVMMPAAPTKPKPGPARPEVDPGTERRPKPPPDPFNPPRPKRDPKPMNFVTLNEAYEDEVHPSNLSFWDGLRDNEHIYNKYRHPVLLKHGAKLSRESYGYTSERTRKVQTNYRQAAAIFGQIIAREQQHVRELTNLAIDAVAEVWQFPKDKLRAMLTPNPTDIEANTEGAEEEVEPKEPNPEQIKQINKRITMNSLTQGSAVHNMMTLHHMVRDRLHTIDPTLLQLYDKMAAGAHHYYWMIDIAALAQQMTSFTAGSSSVKFEKKKDEEGNENEEGKEEPVVDARAICFPVLCQELSKGIMQILTMHGLSNLDAETTDMVLRNADKVMDEPYLIQVGPALWRRFLKVIGGAKGLPSVAHIMAALSSQEPDDVHKIVVAVLENEEIARTLLTDLVAEPNDFDIGEYNPDDMGELDDDDPDLMST